MHARMHACRAQPQPPRRNRRAPPCRRHRRVHAARPDRTTAGHTQAVDPHPGGKRALRLAPSQGAGTRKAVHLSGARHLHGASRLLLSGKVRATAQLLLNKTPCLPGSVHTQSDRAESRVDPCPKFGTGPAHHQPGWTPAQNLRRDPRATNTYRAESRAALSPFSGPGTSRAQDRSAP